MVSGDIRSCLVVSIPYSDDLIFIILIRVLDALFRVSMIFHTSFLFRMLLLLYLGLSLIVFDIVTCSDNNQRSLYSKILFVINLNV